MNLFFSIHQRNLKLYIFAIKRNKLQFLLYLDQINAALVLQDTSFKNYLLQTFEW